MLTTFLGWIKKASVTLIVVVLMEDDCNQGKDGYNDIQQWSLYALESVIIDA